MEFHKSIISEIPDEGEMPLKVSIDNCERLFLVNPNSSPTSANNSKAKLKFFVNSNLKLSLYFVVSLMNFNKSVAVKSISNSHKNLSILLDIADVLIGLDFLLSSLISALNPLLKYLLSLL